MAIIKSSHFTYRNVHHAKKKPASVIQWHPLAKYMPTHKARTRSTEGRTSRFLPQILTIRHVCNRISGRTEKPITCCKVSNCTGYSTKHKHRSLRILQQETNALEWEFRYRLQGVRLANQPYFMFTLLCLAVCTSQLSNTNSCRQSGWTQLNAGKTDWHSHINPCHAGFCLRKPPSTWPIILSGAYKPHTATFNGWQMSGHASCIDHKHHINSDKKASEISRALDREGQIHFMFPPLCPPLSLQIRNIQGNYNFLIKTRIRQGNGQLFDPPFVFFKQSCINYDCYQWSRWTWNEVCEYERDGGGGRGGEWMWRWMLRGYVKWRGRLLFYGNGEGLLKSINNVSEASDSGPRHEPANSTILNSISNHNTVTFSIA